MKGKIKWFKADKGYGFIAGEDNVDYFVHHTQLPKDKLQDKLNDQEVTFDAITGDRGPQAQSVKFTGNTVASEDDEE